MRFPIIWCEIKYICRMHGLLFWSLALPILLSTLFSLTLTDVYGQKNIEKIKAGIVYQKGYTDEDYTMDASIFDATVLGEEQAEVYLKDGIIAGYLKLGETCELVVLDNGYAQMMLKNALDEYIRMKNNEPALMKQYQFFQATPFGTHIEEKNQKEIYSAISHYDTILATACICSVFSGLLIVFRVTHPLQARAAVRYQIAPVSSFRLLKRRFIIAWLLQTVLITLSYLYMQFILRIPFHMNLVYILLIHLTGVLVSMLFGAFIGMGNKLTLSVKLGMTAAVILVCAYFSGLMDIHVRASVKERIPFMTFLNPCTLIADAYYALYQLDMHTLMQSLAALLVIGLLSVLFIVLSTGEGRHETV